VNKKNQKNFIRLPVARAVLANPGAASYLGRMITRSDIIWLGLSSGVAGGLVGGLLLGIGMNLVVQGANVGWLLLMPAAPLSGLIGWILARKLARQLHSG